MENEEEKSTINCKIDIKDLYPNVGDKDAIDLVEKLLFAIRNNVIIL